MAKNTDLTVPGPAAIVPYSVDAVRLQEILEETLTPGEQLTPQLLPTIKIPAAGGRNWELPDGSAVPALSGVVLYRQTPRAYWLNAFGEGGGNNAPDCWSADGVAGNGYYDGQHFDAEDGNVLNPGGKCFTCPQSVWGSSGKGNSQACRQLTRLFLMFEDSVLPTVLVLPPSSYQVCQQYAVAAVNRGGLTRVVTTVGLEKDKNPDGIEYSRATFHVAASLDAAAQARIQAYRAAIVPHLKAMAAAPVTEEV